MLTVDSKILRLRIEALEEEVARAHKSLDLANHAQRELNTRYTAQSRALDAEQTALRTARAGLARADAAQEAALRLLEAVEADLEAANALAHSLHAKAESLEVQYAAEHHVLEDLQRENALLKAGADAREQERADAATQARELAEQVATVDAQNLVLAREKGEVAAELEAALQRTKDLEERLAVSEQRSSRSLMRSTLSSWLVRS
jgi:chromosome segregation ATPase